VRDGVGELLGGGHELGLLGREVGLALELDDGGHAAGGGDRDDAIGVVAVGAVDGLGQALLAEELGGGVELAVGLFEGALGIHHPGA
jgi:hypothetical protein